MKVTLVYSVLTFLFITAAFAKKSEGQGVLDKKVTISIQNENFRSALRKISRKAGITFSYSRNTIPDGDKVSITANDEALSRLFASLFDPYHINYEAIGNQVVLKRKIGSAFSFGDAGMLVVNEAIPIRGIVRDDKGNPLAGVSVQVKGTTTGTSTNERGEFSLNVTEDATLVFSFVGYASEEVKVDGRTSLEVTLQSNVSSLEDVVVIGYGTQKKINLTGAVESVGSEVFENRSTSNTTQALQGVVPNLNINLADGKPNRTASFNIRGTTSIGQGGSALVLIDGVEGDPSLLNPNDIKEVTVLKDAASAAVYGARGAFGVVLITTKSPQKGKTSVNYTGNFSEKSLAMKPKFVTDGLTWLEHFREAYVNQSGTLPTSINNNMQAYSDDWLERMKAWKASGEAPKTEVLPNGNYEYYANTDWIGLLFKDQSFAQDHNLSVSGGGEKADYYISGRLYRFDGMYRINPDEYNAYNLRAKASLKAFNWLKLTNNFEFSQNDYHMPYTASGHGANVIRYIEVSAFPTTVMHNPDGTNSRANAYTLGGFETGNNYQNDKNRQFRNTVGFQTNFINNTFRINGDMTYRFDPHDVFWKQVKVPYFINQDQTVPSYVGDINGTILEGSDHTTYTASNIYAEYENNFGKNHYFKGMAGWNYEVNSFNSNTIQRNQLLFEGAESIQLATGSSINPSANAFKWKTAGFFYRLNYSFMNRYLLEVNGRYDGSSRFPTGQQWGFFPSISGGWRLTEEPFWNIGKELISELKVRASYGSLGNGNISPYQFLELFGVSRSGRVLDGALSQETSSPAPIPTGLTWEKATTFDIGLDLSMFNNKFSFNGDYYNRKTTDMYVPGPTLPEIFGADAPKGNYADMTTRGFELSFSWKDQFNVSGKAFKYFVNASFFDYVSTIDKFNNPTKRFTDHYVGQRIGELWGFETDGLFQSDPAPDDYIYTIGQASSDAVWRAGDLKIKNLDGSKDNRITVGQQTVDNPGDMTIIGNTEPRYQYNFTLGVEWSGIFISAFFQGVGKQNWYPGQESAFWGQYNRGYNQMPAWHLNNYWTPDNPDAYLPRYSQYNSTLGWGSAVPNDRYLQNVSYLRLKSAQIGYSLPKSITTKIKMSNARIFLSGENLYSWSPFYKVTNRFMDVSSAIGSSDPDLNSTYNQGAGNGYPLLKTFTLGISLTY